MIEEGAEGARPDIVGTDQPQPVDPLRVGEVGVVVEVLTSTFVSQAGNMDQPGEAGNGICTRGGPLTRLAPSPHAP